MTRFFRRFIGVLTLDASTFEDIEADRRSAMQSLLALIVACLAGGFGSMGQGLVGPVGFVTGAIITLGGWLVWVSVIAVLGTSVLAEPQTRSDRRELLRTLGFAAAPGVFFAFAAMPAIAPFVLVGVSIWMIAAAVLAVRQALDYRSTMRAVAVCVIAWIVLVGIIGGIALALGREVS
jgi:hypothetical protein